MQEIWKDIKDYEGRYQVSNLGNVKSLKTNKLLYCSKSGRTRKYLRVGLHKNKTRKMFSVHELVAKTFIPNPNNYPCINHKDENPSNNCVTNLCWCTYKENINYGTRNLRAKCSSLLYYLRKDYSNHKEVIETAEKLDKLLKQL